MILESENRNLRKIRVCCFCERWESGGIEAFLTNVLRRIDLKKIQVDIVSSSIGQSVFTEQLQKQGVRFLELSGSQRKLVLNSRLFCSLLRREDYDIVHLNIFHGLSLYYAVLAKREGVPVRIAHSHNTALRKSLTQPVKLLIHRIAKKLYSNAATDLWACSKAAAEFLFSKRELEEKGCRFIPNGIDIERFRFDRIKREMVRKELGLEKKFVVGNIGRLCYQKNQAFLLDIFVEIQKRRMESVLLLVGEGDDLPELKKQANQLGIANKVLFYGVSDHVERLLWAMDVFVFPSRFEGLGIAAVEAQTAGLPVLCSEYVPPETEVTELFQRLPLSAGAGQWAKCVLEMPGRLPAGADNVRVAGFDISEVSGIIQAFYER